MLAVTNNGRIKLCAPTPPPLPPSFPAVLLKLVNFRLQSKLGEENN